MAVYTKINNYDVANLLEKYDIGVFEKIVGIESGVVNSNFHLFTDKGRFIITIYEKVSGTELLDLNYFFKLKEHLYQNKILCPLPLKDKQGKFLNSLKNKPCAIVSYLSGSPVNYPKNHHIKLLGENIAKMHAVSGNFALQRKNDFSFLKLHEILDAIKPNADSLRDGLYDEINDCLIQVKTSINSSLPKSVIHADLFCDNVFFDNQKFAGFIDFYFACDGFCVYDLAICLNAWCFEHHEELNVTKFRKLLSGYNKFKTLTELEIASIPTFAKLAAIRFLVTRIYDWHNCDKSALVQAKDPKEFLKRFDFHKNINSYKQYGL